MIVVPRPCVFGVLPALPLLKLHTMRSPFVINPAVAGAMVRPYGFWSPLMGSMAEPMVGIAPEGAKVLSTLAVGVEAETLPLVLVQLSV